LPFIVCGFLKLLEVAAYLRSRAAMNRNVEISAFIDDSKNDLL
jgi:hypothetical protein